MNSANLASEATPQGTRMPWSLGAAALVAFIAFFLTSGRTIGIPVLSLMLIASYLTRFRLSQDRVLGAIVRIVPMTAIVMVVGLPDEEFFGWYLKRSYTDLLGYLLATELVIHAWTAQTVKRFNSESLANGTVIFLTALLMITASNTYNRTTIQVLMPIYAIFVLITLRVMQPKQPTATDRRVRRSLVTLRFAAALIALFIGFAGVASVTYFDSALTRWASRMLQQNRRTQKSEIGLSAAPRLQGVFNPGESIDRVLVIDGSQAERYMRAMACDTYVARQWKPTVQERPFTPVDRNALKQDVAGDHLQITRLSDTFDLLLTPLETSDLDPHSEAQRDDFGTVKNVNVTTLGGYDAIVPTRPGHQGVACLPLTDERRDAALAFPPELDPQVAALAKEVAGDGDAFEKIVRIRNHLRNTHAYSLSYNPSTDDPLSDFILNKGAAHCQYFASAVVVMARAVGIPARFVSGYIAHETYNDNQLVVRQRDAHAWAECYVEGTGWITMDATPSGGRPSEMFDETSAWQRWWEGMQDRWTAFREWLANLRRSSILLVIGVPTGLLIVLRFVQWLRKRRRPRGNHVNSYANTNAELAAAARRFERSLATQGMPLTPSRTWREHVALLGTSTTPTKILPPIDRTLYLRFIDAYDRARFDETAPAAVARVNELIDTIERSPEATSGRTTQLTTKRTTRRTPGD